MLCYSDEQLIWSLIDYLLIFWKAGLTPLHLAVESGQDPVVELLLGFGASVHVKTTFDLETPLHIAARTKEGATCAKLLIKSGANVNATEKVFIMINCYD